MSIVRSAIIGQLYMLHIVTSTTCFNSLCTSAKRITGECHETVCLAGLYGCFKSTVYYGGPNEEGLYDNEQGGLVTWRGCWILPTAHTGDSCLVQPFLPSGRTVTCYCDSDLCNGGGAISHQRLPYWLICVISTVVFLRFVYPQ